MNIKHIHKAIQLTYRCDPKGFVLKVAYVFIQNILPLVLLVVLKMLVDMVTSGQIANPKVLFVLVTIFCGVVLIQRLISTLSSVNNDIMTQKLIDTISARIQHQAYVLDMAYYDNPEFHDTFHRAQQEASYRPIQLLNNAMVILGSCISLLGILVILASTAWWIILLMALAVMPSLAVRSHKARAIYWFRKNNTQLYRKTAYYSSLLTNRSYAKEIRTFGLAPLFRQRFVETRKQLVKILLHISRKLAVYDSLCAIIEVCALGIITLFLIRQTYLGVVSVGGFVMAFEAFRKGQGNMQTLISGVTGMYENRLFVSNLFEFLELKPTIVAPAQPKPFPIEVDTVEFRDVTFRYPDMDKDVLSHYNLYAKRGEITKIEGRNGFGKTTLLKLLLRLYDVDSGAVLINGIDVRDFNPIELRQHIGAIFQDYVQFNCTVRENIEFGDLHSGNHSEERLLRAAKLSGADDIVSNLPQGYDTLLGRLFSGGEDLSMGQWQRIALARQLYSEAPILFFDEPMSWMDLATRQKVQATLEELKTKHLIILIKHI